MTGISGISKNDLPFTITNWIDTKEEKNETLLCHVYVQKIQEDLGVKQIIPLEIINLIVALAAPTDRFSMIGAISLPVTLGRAARAIRFHKKYHQKRLEIQVPRYSFDWKSYDLYFSGNHIVYPGEKYTWALDMIHNKISLGLFSITFREVDPMHLPIERSLRFFQCLNRIVLIRTIGYDTEHTFGMGKPLLITLDLSENKVILEQESTIKRTFDVYPNKTKAWQICVNTSLSEETLDSAIFFV